MFGSDSRRMNARNGFIADLARRGTGQVERHGLAGDLDLPAVRKGEDVIERRRDPVDGTELTRPRWPATSAASATVETAQSTLRWRVLGDRL